MLWFSQDRRAGVYLSASLRVFFYQENITTRKNYTETVVGGDCVRQQLRSEHLGNVLSNKEGCVPPEYYRVVSQCNG